LTAGSVVATQSPNIAFVLVMNRLEVAPLVVSVSSAAPRATSPRAPPALYSSAFIPWWCPPFLQQRLNIIELQE
jgi:hypothetical protein